VKINKNCQSCGMPMKKDPAGGGTNVDVTINLHRGCIKSLLITAEALRRREIIIDNQCFASLRLRGLKEKGTFNTPSNQ